MHLGELRLYVGDPQRDDRLEADQLIAQIEELGALDTHIDPEETIAMRNDEALRLFNLLEEVDLEKVIEVENR